MKNSLHKILIWVIGFVITGMMTSCEDIFDELSVNPNQLDVNSFYTTPENCNKGVLGIYGYISTPVSYTHLVQGPGQACNLRDNGFNVIVGQRPGKTCLLYTSRA